MSSGSQNEKLLKDMSFVKALQKEHTFLKNWPDYHFDSMRGIYNSKFDYMCEGLKGSSEYTNKQNCVKLFSIIDNILHRGGLRVNDDIWKAIVDLFEKNKQNIDLTSNHMISYINVLGKVLEKGLIDDFKKFKSSYGNYSELDHISKLFYFTQNVGDIKTIMSSPNDPRFVPCCDFVNQCLEIYRRIKELKCSSNSPHIFSPSTLCVEANSFFETYMNTLYKDLKSRNLVNTVKPIVSSINCHYYDPPEKGFLSRYIGYTSSALPYSTKVGLLSFSAIMGSFGLFLLYKYTPVGYLFGREKKKTRRTWRRMEHPYEQGLYEDMSNIDTNSESTNYMSHYDSQRMRDNVRNSSEIWEDTTTIESTSTSESTSYGSSQKFGNSMYGSSETLGKSTYGSSQTQGSSTHDVASRALGGSSHGSSQTRGGSSHGSSQTLRSSKRGASQTLGDSTYGSSETLGDSTYASSQTLGDSTYASSQTLGSAGSDSSRTMNTMRK